MEKEFIDLRISTLATKKIINDQERCTKEVRIIGLLARKKVLGSFFRTVEKDDPDLLKEINKRTKLENQRMTVENLMKSKNDKQLSASIDEEKIDTNELSHERTIEQI